MTRTGYIIDWKQDGRGIPKSLDFCSHLAVGVIARGKGAEFKPAKYRVRGPHGWSSWRKTNDLAGDMGVLGFDTPWPCVPEPVQDFIVGRRGTLPQIVEVEMTGRFRAGKPEKYHVKKIKGWEGTPSHRRWLRRLRRYLRAYRRTHLRPMLLNRREAVSPPATLRPAGHTSAGRLPRRMLREPGRIRSR